MSHLQLWAVQPPRQAAQHHFMMLHWYVSAAALPLCRLPSFTDKFQAKEPLTRIRDIAHRNDIPHDIKKEIKHTIQVGRLLTQFSDCGAAGSV